MAQLLTPQISWHGREPVLGVDVSLSGLVASAGNDNEVRLWKIKTSSTEQPDVIFHQELTGHSKPVNAVRFSPDGETLASASDDTSIILWKDKGVRSSSFGSSAPQGDGTWGPLGVLRGHCADVYDLSWSPDGLGLVSGGVDGSCIVWNIAKARVQQTMRDHEHYVQGVAWDPRGEFVVSVSCDRSARVYSNRTRKGALRDFTCTAAISKTRCSGPDPTTLRALASAGAAISGGTPAAAAPGAAAVASGSDCPAVEPPAAMAPDAPDTLEEGAEASLVLPIDEAKRAKEKEVRMFLDDTVPSFFRRPAWSPDGSFLLLPCGQHTDTPQGRPAPATLVLARSDLSSPCAFLPGPAKPVVAVRCCPVLFELRPPAASEERAAEPAVPAAGTPLGETPAASSWLPLGYRVVWAVATLDAILVYDSQHASPLLLATSLHYAALTDVAWLPGGRGLITSSSDGYCTLVMLEEGQLGTPLPTQKLPACMQPSPPHGAPAQAAGKPQEHPAGGRAAEPAEALAPEPTPVTGVHIVLDAKAQVGVGSPPPLYPDSLANGCNETPAADANMADADRSAASPAPLPTDATPAKEESEEGHEKITGVVVAGMEAPIELGMTHSDGLQVKKKPKRAVLVEMRATGA